MTDNVATINIQPPRPQWGVRGDPMKAESASVPIRTVPIPDVLHIPVDGPRGARPNILVAAGERVQAGQKIASRAPGAASVHAPASGTVTSIESAYAAVPAMALCETIVIDTDDTDIAFDPPAGDPMVTAPSDLREAIAAGGIVGLGGALFPTAAKLNAASSIHTLIVNGAECEPYISCDDRLLQERPDRVIRGAMILARATGATQCVIAIENDMTDAWHAVHDALEQCAEPRPGLAVVTAKYPAGGERQLVEMLLDQEVPLGGYPSDLGVLCQNVGTVAAVADLFDRGQPLVSRIVTMTGMAVARPGNYEVAIGTPVSALIDAAGGLTRPVEHLVMGGPMMGIALPDQSVPVTRATNCIIAAAPDELISNLIEMPCIRCSECVQVCPARLLPHELVSAVRGQATDELDALGVDACIECGCCDYICPSAIPITSTLIEGKRLLERQRFEIRRGDMAVERQAAHEARVAREARQRESELADQIRDIGVADADSDPVAEAIQRARARRNSTDEPSR